MEKKIYSGLTTLRVKVTGQPIMAESESKLKVKTKTITTGSGTTEWQEDNTAGTLGTSISSEL